MLKKLIMEPQESLEQKAGVAINKGVAEEPETGEYLRPWDLLDNLVIRLKEELEGDVFPTPARQRYLVAGVKHRDVESARELADSHMGMIAAVAYPFRHGELSDEDLLRQGRRALVKAAMSYQDEEGFFDFNDHAVQTIHEALSESQPDLAAQSFIKGQKHPMDFVYQFVNTFRLARSPEETAENLGLTEKEREILPLLIEPETTAAEAMKISVFMVRYLKTSLRNKFNASPNELPLAALRRGVLFDVPQLTGLRGLTITERQVGMRLYKRNPGIANELSLGVSKVSKVFSSLKRKVGPEMTRGGLLVTAHMNNFEPTEEEIEQSYPMLLDRLSHDQMIIARLILDYKNEDISRRWEEFGLSRPVSEAAVNGIVSRIERKAGAANRTQLILKLYQEGMDFEVPQPDRPIGHILSPVEIRIARLLHITSNEDIAEIVGKSASEVGYYIAQAKMKLKANSRQGLALMVEIFQDEETARAENLTEREWMLAKRLGFHAMTRPMLEEDLSHMSDKQREVLDFYYLTSDEPTWERTGEEFKVSTSVAKNVAFRGIKKATRELELLELSVA